MINLEINNLNVSYGQETILKNISFSLNQGEMLAIIGPNGAGKTTLLKSILGIIPTASGMVLINGMSPQKAIQSLKGQIAYLAQHHQVNLLLPLTVYDVAAQGLMARKAWGQRLTSEEKEKIEYSLERVFLKDKKDDLFINLSGGQRQRALLALVLSQNPKLLFLDEPTSALDIASIEQIYKILDELKKDKVGVLVISHDISAIVSASDRIGVLMKEMKYFGKPTHLSENVIHQVFGAHIKIIPNDPYCGECHIPTKFKNDEL